EDQFQEDPPEDPPEVPMADNQTMAELLQAPTEGYEDVIVIPKIATNNFELKHGLINLFQNKQFFEHDKEDPHAHIRYFNKITSMMRVPNVPILPSLKTTNLRNEITRFQQRFDESFYEAWDCFNDLLRACTHHGFSELHQLDTFYNALNVNDQDSLNSTAGGNFLDKIPQECLKIIESKAKVCQSRANAVVAKVSTSSSTPAISSDVAELKDMVRTLLLDKKNQSSALAYSPTPAPVKAVEPNCITCGGAHSYQNCPTTSENVYRDNIQEYVSQAAAANYNQGNTITHRLSTVYHPQTSGQVEVSNCGLKRILERTIGENRASWSDKLYDALWAFRIAYKTSIGCTPYKLVYGKACYLSIELEHKAYWALKQANFDLTVAGDHRKVQLNELNDLRDHAYEDSLIYKENTKRIHGSKIKNRVFNVGYRVCLFNSRLKILSGKLKTRWSGPFIITKVFPYGTVELSQANGPNFKVNGHRVKHYFGGDVPQLVVSDLQTFPMNQ
nr:reverse transcriptase domain-containing protein [Tanacetum cinerariifolium]